MGTLVRKKMSGCVRKVRIQSIWVNKQKKICKIIRKNNGNLECWRAMWKKNKTKKPKVKKSKFEDMQDKGRWSGKILERSRRTISRMLCKRHRKSFYCRHRQQLWGNKKKNSLVLLWATGNCKSCFIISLLYSNVDATVERLTNTYCLKREV